MDLISRLPCGGVGLSAYLQAVEQDVQRPALHRQLRLRQHGAGEEQFGATRRGVPVRREFAHLSRSQVLDW